jgi:hypothetical protein
MTLKHTLHFILFFNYRHIQKTCFVLGSLAYSKLFFVKELFL